MIRTLAALAAALAVGPDAFAQLIVRPPPSAPRPAGVIQPPSLPVHGALTAPSPTPIPRPLPLPGPFPVPNPLFGAVGYAPYWSGGYGYGYGGEPVIVNNFFPAPTVLVTPPAAAPAPAAAPDPRARLTLTLPLGARVWLAGKEMDANASPVVLESPVLQAGQSYTFNVKVAWPDGSRTEERARSVTVEAGDEKSLKFFQ